MIGPLCIPYSVCLNSSFWQGSFVWKIFIFSMVVLPTKIWYSKRKFFAFQKTCFVKVLKMFKISRGCHITICWSLKRRVLEKSLVSHSVHWGINSPPLKLPLFLAKPLPLKSANCPTPPFLGNPSLCIGFSCHPPLKSDFSVNPKNIKVFHR